MTRRAAFRWGPALVHGTARLNPDYNDLSRQWEAEVITPEGVL